MASSSPSQVNLEDARALLRRAQRHFEEFNCILNPPGEPPLWSMNERFDEVAQEWSYSLRAERGRFVEAKPALADSATNLVSALDHVVAAIARSRGHPRLRNSYYPWGFEDSEFEKALKKAEKFLGPEMTEVLAAARIRHRHEVHHMQAVREISNTGKHWELLLGLETVHAIAQTVPGSPQRFFPVPAEAFRQSDAYEFHRDTVRLPRRPFEMLIGLSVGGLADALPSSPDSIFPCAFRFVEGTIESVAGSG